MTNQEFFDRTSQHLGENLPFVIYRKPTNPEDRTFSVDGFFQEDDALHSIADFQESGFVFAPFDSKEDAVFISSDKSKKTTATFQPSEELDASTQQVPVDKIARAAHEDLVGKGLKAIEENNFQKVVLSRKIEVPLKRTAIAIFQRLLRFYPTAFVYCWFHPKVGLWLGATPETLLNISGQTLKTMAVAGTKSAQQNAQPQWTAKEIAEQQFVTDFIKNSLEGEVTNLSVSEVENYRAGNLWHLRTNITGRLQRQENLQQILSDLHPTPAVCGLPKVSAKKFILNHENYGREFYTGFLGELNLKERKVRSANRRNVENQAYSRMRKKTELFVNLRCMQICDNSCSLYVGGGIVKGSRPESEWEETVNKSKTMLDVL